MKTTNRFTQPFAAIYIYIQTQGCQKILSETLWLWLFVKTIGSCGGAKENKQIHLLGIKIN